MADLSPEAQSVLDAYRSSHLSINNLAAALRAAADKTCPQSRIKAQNDVRYKLLAIANELEANEA